MGVGMPDTILLDEFGSKVWDAFGDCPFHVGSSLEKKTGWRDVDVRLILDDETYDSMELGDSERGRENPKWIALCLAFSVLGKAITGLPIDFQIQQRSYANEKFKGGRAAIGMLPFRFKNRKA